MLKARQGFTLIELLIVIVIIGILAAIAIPKFSATREKAYFKAMVADLRNLQTQQELYWSTYYHYADAAGDANLGFDSSPGVTVTINGGGDDEPEWGATAVHAAMPDESCWILPGETRIFCSDLYEPGTGEDENDPPAGT
jgi:prepilin-type N-terminal cleavage/methylation domain-containing protein